MANEAALKIDLDNIKSAEGIRSAHLLKIYGGSDAEMGSLSRVDALRRKSMPRPGAVLHFNENDLIAVPADKVDLLVAETVIRFKDTIPHLFEESGSHALPCLPDTCFIQSHF